MVRRSVEDIDKSLKAAFDDAATQAVPDRFIELLSKLRAAEEEAARRRAGEDDGDV